MPKKRDNPTKRTIDLLTRQGWLCGKTEHYNSYCGRTMDLFNFIDVIALRPGEIAALQITSADNMLARARKITEDESVRPKAIAWLKAGGSIYVIGWGYHHQKGWVPKYKQITCSIAPLDGHELLFVEDLSLNREQTQQKAG